MTENGNIVPKGFLQKYRRGIPDSTVFLPLCVGYLKLEYGVHTEPELLSRVSYVSKKDKKAPAIGLCIEMVLRENPADDRVTFIRENGVSGRQWSHGREIYGTTWDDDAPAPPVRKIPLGDWVQECLEVMVHPENDD